MRFQKKKTGIHEGDLTPMIDMTFQLIAFFMVLVNFSEAETDDRVKLPLSELAKPAEGEMENYVTVHVTDKALCIIDGRDYQLGGIKAVLERRAEKIEDAGRNVSDTIVIIRGHEKVATGKVQNLIAECQEAQFQRFVLRATEDQKY